ncbi:hypothetical protein ACUODJ_27435, partial [Escherichia sp. HC-CC]
MTSVIHARHADACPNVIKEILYRAAERMQMPLVL